MESKKEARDRHAVHLIKGATAYTVVMAILLAIVQLLSAGDNLDVSQSTMGVAPLTSAVLIGAGIFAGLTGAGMLLFNPHRD